MKRFLERRFLGRDERLAYEVADVPVEVAIGDDGVHFLGDEDRVREREHLARRVLGEALPLDRRQAEPEAHAQLVQKAAALVGREHAAG